VFDAIALPEVLNNMHSVGLKQFRDPANSDESCHTSVVEAPLRMVRMVGEPYLFRDGFDIDLETDPIPSHPICAALGLQSGRQPVPWAVFFRATTEMHAGRVMGGRP
jgi:hypothetical protein